MRDAARGQAFRDGSYKDRTRQYQPLGQSRLVWCRSGLGPGMGGTRQRGYFTVTAASSIPIVRLLSLEVKVHPPGSGPDCLCAHAQYNPSTVNSQVISRDLVITYIPNYFENALGDGNLTLKR